MLLCEIQVLLSGANASSAVAAGAVAYSTVGAGTSSSTGAVSLAGITARLVLAALVAAAGSKRNSHNSGENQCNLFHFSTFLYCETINLYENRRKSTAF